MIETENTLHFEGPIYKVYHNVPSISRYCIANELYIFLSNN